MSVPDFHRGCLLYVDDEEHNRFTFEMTFCDDFPVRTAESAPEALSLLARIPVGVLVVDQRMPGMTGIELCERVKLLHPDVVRLALTAWADSRLTQEAINRGEVFRFIEKPWRREGLLPVLASAMALARQREQERRTQLSMLAGERAQAMSLVARRLLHDASTPLTSLHTWTQAVRDASACPDTHRPDTLLQAAEGLELARQSIEQLLQELLREAEGRHPVRLVPVDVAEVSRSSVHLCKHLFGEGSSLELRADTPARILGDPAALGRLFVNLLANAVQASSPHRPNTVCLTVVPEDGRVLCSVADTGVGIPPLVRQLLFDPEITSRPQSGGRGLGLAIVADIVHQHEGAIAVESDPAWGTRFLLSFPHVPTHGA